MLNLEWDTKLTDHQSEKARVITVQNEIQKMTYEQVCHQGTTSPKQCQVKTKAKRWATLHLKVLKTKRRNPVRF